MSGAATRRDLARLARRSGRTERAGRFLARQQRQAPLRFADLCAAPRWPVLEPEGQEQVGAVALLLSGSAILAQEIDGNRLRSYAAVVGYELLEQMLTDNRGGRAPLPSAATLRAEARRLLADRSTATQDRLGQAEHFMREANAWPSI